MDERLRFVARLLEGEKMAPLRARFGISRKTTVTRCGRICSKRRKVNLSHVFAGQNVGLTQVAERIWLVTFMHYDVGYFDDRRADSNQSKTPFGQSVTHVPGMN
jgi:hypothetical protein